jgi:hypothetical protein
MTEALFLNMKEFGHLLPKSLHVEARGCRVEARHGLG